MQEWQVANLFLLDYLFSVLLRNPMLHATATSVVTEWRHAIETEQNSTKVSEKCGIEQKATKWE